MSVPDFAEFTNHALADLPLPDPRYIALHAAAAQVANLSAAGEYIEKYIRDLEKTRVLSKDGLSADLLTFALSSVHVSVY